MLLKHVLPPLPYGYESLEPQIDARTMELHHDKHHAGYVAELNLVLEKLPQLQDRSAVWLLLNLHQVPEELRAIVRNNAGAHVNHSIYWQVMSPVRYEAPKGPLANAINQAFGSFEQFKAQFNEAGKKLLGSGWVWLTCEQRNSGKLSIVTTQGHDNPLIHGLFPILVNDVWEHAYYLKYQNRRAEFMENWWTVVNWQEAARRYDCSGHSAEYEWEYDSQVRLAA